MKFIITNDDGIDAPGLEVLASILREKGDVVVIAPSEERSGVGHAVTSKLPLHLKPAGENRYSVSGTPADCTRVGLKHLVPDADWVISGINPGANLGSDIYNSGTVAAAREAAMLGVPAMAVSQYIARGHGIDWEATRFHAAAVIDALMAEPLPSGHFWNVNLPHPLQRDTPAEFRFCKPDILPHAFEFAVDGEMLQYTGVIHDRPRDPERDVAVCFGGRVAVSMVGL